MDQHLVATRRHRAPEPWAERVEQAGHGTTDEFRLTPQDSAREMLLMGLRLTEGISASRFAARIGRDLSSALDPEALAHARAEGYVTWHGDRLIATEEGRKRLDALLPYLLI